MNGRRTLADIIFGASTRLIRLVAPDRARRRGVVRTAVRYNMVDQENEKFFLSLYMLFITERMTEIFGKQKLKILDAGCGQGRLSLALARQGHDVTGIDMSPSVIEKAKQYACSEGLNIRLLATDLETGLKGLTPGSYDCVISTEVLYMVKDYREVISDLVKLVRPGGLVVLSLRSRLFYVLVCLLQGRFSQASRLAINRDVYLNNDTLNCQSRKEMEALLAEWGVGAIEVRGIGVLSGIPGDPQARFAVPEELGESERTLLLDMEAAVSREYSEFGRYLLVSGIREQDHQAIGEV
jgi:SAM-dependent methyltransferase